MILSNAFSMNMVASFPVTIRVDEVAEKTATQIALNCLSAVGHADTAAVFSTVLGIQVPTNRVTVVLKTGDQALVGQYRGPRLPEGATTLPEGATIQWILVTIG
jgi:hypothetical protein